MDTFSAYPLSIPPIVTVIVVIGKAQFLYYDNVQISFVQCSTDDKCSSFVFPPGGSQYHTGAVHCSELSAAFLMFSIVYTPVPGIRCGSRGFDYFPMQ